MSNINIVGKIGFSWLQDSRLIGLKREETILVLLLSFAAWLLSLQNGYYYYAQK